MIWKIKIVFKNLIVFTILLIVVELILMLMGYEKGFYDKSPDFEKVNKLRMLKGYCADSFGIMKVDQEAADYASVMLTKGKQINMFSKFRENCSLYYNDCHFTPYRVGRDFLEIKLNNYANQFATYISNIQKKRISNEDSLLINYLNHPINSDGFRSVDFKPMKSKKTKVLLLGDSFTWGHKTENITSSFADILLSKDYMVYNTGIVGADLPQYYAIAKKYVTLLKPDVVIVNLYMGNDISKYDRRLKANTPIYYPTNAGNLYSCPHGKYFESAQEAYNHIINISSIPLNTNFNIVMSQTRVSTQLWSILASRDKIENCSSASNSEYFEQAAKREVGYSINSHYINLIKNECDSNDCKVIVSIIPDCKNLEDSPSNYLKEINYFKLASIDESYYAEDGHFNELGHENYAEFLHQLLKNLNYK